MNFNILSYLIYGCITVYIIYYVGQLFHRNGRIFILRLFHQNESQADTTNNILLMAYYLFNIGYAVVQVSFWQSVVDLATLISSISARTAILILILAVTHYCNIFCIYLLSHRNNHSVTAKNVQS